MPYKSHDLSEIFSVLSVAFVVGVIAQYLRQKTDVTLTNTNIIWLSLASGFSAMVSIGLLYEYTDISGAFLVAVSGIAGWAGISILATLSRSFDQLLIKTAEKKLDVKMDPVVETLPGAKEVDDIVPDTASMDSQSE